MVWPTLEKDELSFSLLFGGHFGHQWLYVWRLLHQSMGDKWSKSVSDTSFLQFATWFNLLNRIAFCQHQRIGNRAPSISELFIRSDQIQYSELIIPDFQLQVIIMPRVLCSINCFYLFLNVVQKLLILPLLIWCYLDLPFSYSFSFLFRSITEVWTLPFYWLTIYCYPPKITLLVVGIVNCKLLFSNWINYFCFLLTTLARSWGRVVGEESISVTIALLTNIHAYYII